MALRLLSAQADSPSPGSRELHLQLMPWLLYSKSLSLLAVLIEFLYFPMSASSLVAASSWPAFIKSFNYMPAWPRFLGTNELIYLHNNTMRQML